MVTGRIDQIALGNRKQTNKQTRGRRENPPLSDWSMQTLTPIRCIHQRNTMCTSFRSKRARRFPAELRQTTAKKMQNYRFLDAPRLGRAVAGRNQRFLNFKPFKKGPFEPKSGDSSRDDSSPNSGTFLKFSTLKILLSPPRISSLYKFISMFAKLSTSFFLGDLWFIVRIRVRVRV